jgi:hypothetical protein
MAKKASARAASQPHNQSKPGGENNSKQSDAVSLLNHDHHDVEQLFQQYKSAQTEDARKKLAAQICTEFIAHAKLEKDQLYPVLCKQGAGSDQQTPSQSGSQSGSKNDLAASANTSDKESQTMQRNDTRRNFDNGGNRYRNDPSYGDDQGSYGRQSGGRQDEFGRSFGNDERDAGQFGQGSQGRYSERYGQSDQRGRQYSQQSGGYGGQQGGHYGDRGNQFESRDSDRYGQQGNNSYGNQGRQQYGNGSRGQQHGQSGGYDEGGQYGGQGGRGFSERDWDDRGGGRNYGNQDDGRFNARPGNDRESRGGDFERYAPGYGGDPVYANDRSRNMSPSEDERWRREDSQRYGTGRGGNNGGSRSNPDRNASSESSLRGVQDRDDDWQGPSDHYISRKGYQQR